MDKKLDVIICGDGTVLRKEKKLEDKLMCPCATTTASSEGKATYQYCDKKGSYVEGQYVCQPYKVPCVPFATGCACEINAYREVRHYKIKQFAEKFNERK